MAFSLDQFYRLNRRALIWIILAVLLYLLRDFFGLIFLTFVLAFIAAPMARVLQRVLHASRRVAIILVYGCFLLALVSFGRFVVPSVIKEANTLLGNLDSIETKLIELKSQLVALYPSTGKLVNGYLRGTLPEREQEALRQAMDYLKLRGARIKPSDETLSTSATLAAASPTQTDRVMNQFVLAYLAGRVPATQLDSLKQDLGSNGAAAPPPTLAALGPDLADLVEGRVAVPEDELLIRLFIRRQFERLREYAPDLVTLLWRASVTTLLALLFSFLISLDILRLSREIQSLRASRLRDFYEQTAQPVVRFAYVVGRAIQAQAVIACANTALTLVGLLLLGIPSVAMLSLIVFLCSFIPVLGVFISTTPIVLVALNSGGLGMAAAAIGFVILVHIVEAYVLNPLIYGRHLKLNPVMVLVILFVGHHAFGIWGMLLGVPVSYYFLHYVFGVPVWGEGRLHDDQTTALGAMPHAAAGPETPDPTHPRNGSDADRAT